MRGGKTAGSRGYVSGTTTVVAAAFGIAIACGLLLAGRGNVAAQSVYSPGAVVRIVSTDRPGAPPTSTEIAIHPVGNADAARRQAAWASLAVSGGKDKDVSHGRVATSGSGRISERLAGMVRKTESPVSQVSLSLDVPPDASSASAPATSPARSEVRLTPLAESERSVIGPADEESSGNVLRATSNMPQELELASAWTGEHYFSVSRDVPGQDMVKLTGDYLTKVFEGPYKNAPKWAKEMASYVQGKGRQVKKTYFFYTTCPKCAKTYGKNYVVAVSEVQ